MKTLTTAALAVAVLLALAPPASAKIPYTDSCIQEVERLPDGRLRICLVCTAYGQVTRTCS